ncbi:MAG: nucleoside deaminase [Holosporaceae bacterium]|nr:nucleoside deaminase [Holosporaceae bacterium]
MQLAIEEAEKAGARGSIPVGSVLVRHNKIIASAGNEVIKNHDATAHAEILVIREASRIMESHILDDCDLYVTLEPCAMCAQAISLARIRRLYFGAYDAKYGAVEKPPYVFDHAFCKPEIIGGVRETQCTQILQFFFRREKK